MNLRRSVSLAVALAAGLVTAGLAAPQDPPPLGQQDSDITVILDRSQRGRLRLAFPAPASDLAGEAARAGAELEATLRADLEASGVFILQGPQELAVLEPTGERERDFELYRSLGNELLLEASLEQDGDRLVLDGRLWELSSRRNLLAKRYRGRLTVVRRIAHTFSDDLVEFFTGRRGIALTSIAFHSDRSAQGAREIYVMDYDGFNQRPVTAHETLSMAPDWSPDARRLVYLSYVTRTPGIHAVDLSTGRKTELVTDGDLNISPAYSPDGRWIAFARTVGGGNSEIFICRSDGSDLRRLTHAGGIDTNPAWSPTGREIAFTSSRSGSPQIYLMSREGTDLRRVTFDGEYNDGAAFSPDGTRIAHSSRRGNLFELALTDLVTRESRLLPLGAGSHESPTFSPDGRKIAFASTRGGPGGRTTQIFVADLDGSNARQLTHEGNNSAPAWSKRAP